jgi:hypothetical protein
MRATVACALIAAGCALVLAGLVVLDEGAKGALAAVVGPAVAAVAAGALLLPRRVDGSRGES